MKHGLIPVLGQVHFSSVVPNKYFSLGVAVPQAKLNNTPLVFGTKSLIQSMCIYESSNQAKSLCKSHIAPQVSIIQDFPFISSSA